MTNDLEQFRREADKLQAFLIEHLPLARAAGVQVDNYTGQALIVSAPLGKNINDKGTAFGGSLYNLCVIAAWGMTHLKAKELGLEGDIVVAKGEITYLRPLRGKLIAKACAPDKEQLNRAQQGFSSRKKAIFNIKVTVQDEDQQTCVDFVGKYALLQDKIDIS